MREIVEAAAKKEKQKTNVKRRGQKYQSKVSEAVTLM